VPGPGRFTSNKDEAGLALTFAKVEFAIQSYRRWISARNAQEHGSVRWELRQRGKQKGRRNSLPADMFGRNKSVDPPLLVRRIDLTIAHNRPGKFGDKQKLITTRGDVEAP
jgi:hypothetical protein